MDGATALNSVVPTCGGGPSQISLAREIAINWQCTIVHYFAELNSYTGWFNEMALAGGSLGQFTASLLAAQLGEVSGQISPSYPYFTANGAAASTPPALRPFPSLALNGRKLAFKHAIFWRAFWVRWLVANVQSVGRTNSTAGWRSNPL